MHTSIKRGRPGAVFKAANGEQVAGLMRLKDGRWRASGPDKFTFREPDETLAIRRFRKWQDVKAGKAGAIQVFLDDHEEALKAAALRAKQVGNVQIAIDRQLTVVVTDNSLRPGQWDWLRDQLLKQPKWVAERVGIEQIGYLADLPKPTPSPTLAEVGKLYLDHARVTEHWRAKCELFWGEFSKAVGVTKLRNVTQEHIVAYGDTIRDAKKAPTYARQRYGAIKTILNFPPKRGKWAEDAKRAAALCAVLVPPRKSAVSPKPIDPEVFKAVLAAADEQMAALLLLSLNACMYAAEVAALNWEDVDLTKGTLCSVRNKTGIVRVAVLWPRTIDALNRLPRPSNAIFFTPATKMQHNANTVFKAFLNLKKRAKQPHVQFSQIRDGAYTAAVEAGVDLNLCRLLAGHATGISDHYVKRRPQMVAAACQAIEQAYFG